MVYQKTDHSVFMEKQKIAKEEAAKKKLLDDEEAEERAKTKHAKLNQAEEIRNHRANKR